MISYLLSRDSYLILSLWLLSFLVNSIPNKSSAFDPLKKFSYLLLYEHSRQVASPSGENLTADASNEQDGHFGFDMYK